MSLCFLFFVSCRRRLRLRTNLRSRVRLRRRDLQQPVRARLRRGGLAHRDHLGVRRHVPVRRVDGGNWSSPFREEAVVA